MICVITLKIVTINFNGKAKLNDTKTTSFHSKEAKNSSHYWKRLLIVTNWLIQNLPELYMTKISSTFAEIQGITYVIGEMRSCPKILRLSNITFTHALLLLIHIKDNLKSPPSRKLFCVYYLSIVRYAPIQFHLFSSRTVNTEFFTMFTAMKRDTNNSSKLNTLTMLWKTLSYRYMQEVRYNILVEKAISFTFTIYIVQSSYNYKIPPSVITGLNDTHLSFNVFWKDKLTFFWKNICGGLPEMMVLFSRTSLISLPTVLFQCIIFDLGQ